MLSRGHIRLDNHARLAPVCLGLGQCHSDTQTRDARSDASGQAVGAVTKTDTPLANLPRPTRTRDPLNGRRGSCAAPPIGSSSSRNWPGGRVSYPLLTIYADLVDDLEKSRIATENRIRALRDVKGLAGSPEEERLDTIAMVLAESERKATNELKRAVKAHPLGEWISSQMGVGEKQAGRLLGALGDPATRFDSETGELVERTVSQLWSYCGYGDARRQVRRRGERANWNSTLKMRAYLIAEATVKAGVRKLDDCDDSDGYDLHHRIAQSPYAEVYLATRAKYADALHAEECKRCGPSGKAAPPGSPLNDGHRHARALRLVAKTFLRDLWEEARRVHTATGAHARVDPTRELLEVAE